MPEKIKHKKIRIGDILVAKQVISEKQLIDALEQQRSSGRKLGRTLIDLNYVDETTLLSILSEQLSIPFVELNNFNYERAVVQTLPETVSRRFRVAALTEDDSGVLLGMSDPTDIFCLDEVHKILGKTINPVVVRESELLDILDTTYNQSQKIASIAEELNEELSDELLDIDDIAQAGSDSDAPVARLLQKIFEEAIKFKASDVHIEPDENVLRIRQRIDGVLVEQVMNEKRIAPALVVRLKLISGLDISEKRLPQDGRFHLKISKKNIDVRISTMPVQHGESVVMRLLSQEDGLRDLADIGMSHTVLEKFQRAVHSPYGLVLVTGPTGSGKTTTLYGALAELNSSDKKIITVEDPVEYRLPRLNQVQIKDKIGLDFATVLKASLRQDPDILFIGEIRDADSAEIALRAAMTGHLVLSTLHTNDAVTSALRLTDMGVDPFLVAAALKTVIAQRLIRKVCDSCKKPYQPNDAERNYLAAITEPIAFVAGSGCAHCFNTGYRGRMAIFELLTIDSAMATALRDKDVNRFNQAANEQTASNHLAQEAFRLAVEGVTTLSEVMRVSAQITDQIPAAS